MSDEGKFKRPKWENPELNNLSGEANAEDDRIGCYPTGTPCRPNSNPGGCYPRVCVPRQCYPATLCYPQQVPGVVCYPQQVPVVCYPQQVPVACYPQQVPVVCYPQQGPVCYPQTGYLPGGACQPRMCRPRYGGGGGGGGGEHHNHNTTTSNTPGQYSHRPCNPYYSGT